MVNLTAISGIGFTVFLKSGRGGGHDGAMDYVKLGSTGLEVSRLCLGCMTFGIGARGHTPWSLDEEASRPLLRQAVDAGVNFFDTANIYSGGTSEEIVGKILGELGTREDFVIATKVASPMRPGPNGSGLSRKAIFAELDDSLRRLNTDYIDLYQIHRWDDSTPIEETMEALHDAVKSGKVRYIGASTMWAWQFSKAQYVAMSNGWTPFVSMQNHYNLLMREEEREMMPLLEDMGIGMVPWSPLARGRLAREWGETTSRFDTDPRAHMLYQDSDKAIVDAVGRVADARGVSRAQIALAWVLRNPLVNAPVVGATKPEQFDDAVAALGIVLTDDEAAELEGPYTTRWPTQ